MRNVIASLAAGVAAAGLVVALSSTTISGVSRATACPVTGAGAAVSCVMMPDTTANRTGLQVTDSKSQNPGTLIMATDSHGAPIFAVTWTGTYSFGAPGFPGGLDCTTRVLNRATCLEPNVAGVAFYDLAGQRPAVMNRRDVLEWHLFERFLRHWPAFLRFMAAHPRWWR